MWAKRIQETISERPDEEDCESYDRKNSSFERERNQRRSLTKIDRILETQKTDSNDLCFLKKKSAISKFRDELDRKDLYVDTEPKSTRVDNSDSRNSKTEKVILKIKFRISSYSNILIMQLNKITFKK
jgi:hypothetical protein